MWDSNLALKRQALCLCPFGALDPKEHAEGAEMCVRRWTEVLVYTPAPRRGYLDLHEIFANIQHPYPKFLIPSQP